MTRSSIIPKAIALVLMACMFNCLAAEKSLFNGKDLSGWKGSPELWKVEDGVIVGTTVGHEIENNTFLIYTKGKVQNFHLKAKLRMTGTNNSGIMYRAQPIEGDEFALSGPQMDIHPKPEYQGMYYSEKTGRGIVARRGQKVLIPEELNKKGKTTPKVQRDSGTEPVFDLSEWNTYEIISMGRRTIHKINGIVTVDVIDRDPTLKLRGAIAFQLHRGPEMTIFVKDVELKQLKGEEGRKVLQNALKK